MSCLADTAFVKSRNEWFNIGDSKVSPANAAEVRKVSAGYILFFVLLGR
jgi:hypothetical protein